MCASTPNENFDPALLRRLDELLEPKQVPGSNAERFPFATAVGTVQKLFRLGGPSSDASVAVLFREDLTLAQKQFVCAYFVRLLMARPETREKEASFVGRLTQLVALVGPREYYAGLDAKALTHQRWQALERHVTEIEKSLSQTFASLKELSSFGVFRQNFLQRFRPKATQFMVGPFLPQVVAIDIRMSDLLGQVDAYIQEASAEKPHKYAKVKSGLEDLAKDAAAVGTRYAQEYVGKPVARLLELLRDDYENGPYAKPGEVEVLSTEKRYALGEEGASFNVSFTIRNKGPGLVWDLQFELLDLPGAELSASSVFLGDLAPGDRRVEIPVVVRKPQSDGVTSCGRVSWRQFDGSRRQEDYLVAVQLQRFRLVWKALERADPYPLEPVTSEAHLIGREAILDQLLAQTRSNTIVSSFVIGQKRVGKTSIVRTLQAVQAKEGGAQSVMYIEGGDYVNPDPSKTVAELGRCMCRTIIEQNVSLAGLVIPVFENSLSPIAQFLAEVSKRLPSHKFIFILDEFDELPIGLYKNSDVGDAMFLTIRSISGKPPYGFILVGSEKLKVILSFQGERLNKFVQLNVDYFDREKEWRSYCDLVRKPVAEWLEIDDQAVVAIYKSTAGHPFLTKLVCRELFKLMVKRRDTHVTEREMEEALSVAVQVASSVNFQHFWDDGIFESGAKKEHVSVLRRKMLMAFADTVRTDGAVGTNTLKDAADRYGVDEVAFEEYLREFVARGVWVVEGSFVACKVPLFSDWLRRSGVKSIISTIVDAEAAIARRRQSEKNRVGPAELVQLTQKFGNYKGLQITEDRVRAWIEQFGPDLAPQRLMFRLLQAVRFYSGTLVREKMRQMHKRIGVDDMIGPQGKRRMDILISYIDGPGKSGVHNARIYAEENNLHLGNIVEPRDIPQRLRSGEISTLLFVDDIVATGETALRGLRKVLQQIRSELNEVGIPVILASVCVFDRARATVEAIGAECGCDFTLLAGDILSNSDRAFHADSRIFESASDLEAAKALALDKGRGLEPKCPLGYGECEALVVFASSCPNNTLPILWSQHRGWGALFPRL